MKQSITTGQIERAARFCVDAGLELRDEGQGRWTEEGYASMVMDRLFDGRYWRRVARIESVESARRELLYVEERLKSRGVWKD